MKSFILLLTISLSNGLRTNYNSRKSFQSRQFHRTDDGTPPDDSMIPPLFAYNSPDPNTCAFYAPNDARCQRVVLNHIELRIPYLMLNLGSIMPETVRIKLYFSLKKAYVFGDHHIREYDIKINRDGHYGDPWNRMTILHEIGMPVARAWFSFALDGEYYSFNVKTIDLHDYHTLLMQFHGPFGEYVFQGNNKTRISDLQNQSEPAYHHHFLKYNFHRNSYASKPRCNTTQWSQWTPCSVRCGKGNTHRFRNVLTNPANPNCGFGGRPPKLVEVKDCIKPSCPKRIPKLKFKATDGLFAWVLSTVGQSYSYMHQFLMLQGHRDTTNTVKISVTVRFSQEFISNLGIMAKTSVVLLASRTIYEVNRIFEESATLIRLEPHCFLPIDVMDDKVGNSMKDVLERYNQPDVQMDADLTIVFVSNLASDTEVLSYDYDMDKKRTTVILHEDLMFASEEIAHEIGHVLGAGHDPDPEFPKYQPHVFYAQGYITPKNKYCTIMASIPCTPLPFFSNPKKTFEKERIGVENAHDNVQWIRQNRYVLRNVGKQNTKCPRGTWLPWDPSLVNCLTNSSETGWVMCYPSDPDDDAEWNIKRPRVI